MSEVIYAEPRQRTHALHLGMWAFLGSETLLFAGLFGLYAGYRSAYSDAFRAGVAHNNAAIGTANTVVLITSSFFVAYAVHAVRAARSRAAVRSLCVAILLGLTFLVLKSIEYTQHFHEGFAPGRHYSSTELPAHGTAVFFGLYYAMTGLHAFHVIGGMCVLAWLAVRVHRGRTRADHHTEIELGGLYWHLVDVVSISCGRSST